MSQSHYTSKSNERNEEFVLRFVLVLTWFLKLYFNNVTMQNLFYYYYYWWNAAWARSWDLSMKEMTFNPDSTTNGILIVKIPLSATVGFIQHDCLLFVLHTCDQIPREHQTSCSHLTLVPREWDVSRFIEVLWHG